MRVFLGSPSRRLLQATLSALSEPAPLVVLPTGAASLPLRLPNLPMMEWHSFWQSLVGQTRLTGVTTAHLALCAELCQHLLNETDYFGKVRRSPRFHRQLVARWVEWRQNGLTPEKLEQAAQSVAQPPLNTVAGIDSPALREEWLRKTGELAMLWRGWEQRLRERRLLDPGACWWEAVSLVQWRQVSLPARLLLWGFHDLHAVDIALLHAAEQANCEVNLALLYDPTLPEYFAPVQRLLARLPPATRSELPNEPHGAGRQPMGVVLSVADSLREAEVVARQILHHLRQGVPPEHILIFLRQPAEAAERLSLLFERYGIPFTLEAQQPLNRAPFVCVLLDALRLLLGKGFSSDWLEWLQNPYLGFTRETHHRLMQIGKQARTADEWLEQAQRHLQAAPLFEPIFASINALRDRLRQPSSDLHATLTLLVQWLAPRPEDSQAQNDLAAAKALLELVRAYMPLLQRMPPTVAVAYLDRLCDAELYPHAWGRGGVRVLPLEQAGLVQAPLVFVMELIEGILPRRHPDDPFLRELERHALQAFFEGQGEVVYLPLRSERQRVEPMLFYEAITAATEQLYLSYPRTMENGETLPSSYLQRLPMPCEQRFYRLEELIPPESECLHPYDLALAHAQQRPLEGSSNADPSDAPERLTLPRTRQRVIDIDRVFSVSELETLARCPFQHLFRHRLRVRIPRRGLHLTQIGTILHAALRHAYRQHRHHPPDSPEWAQALLDSLQRVLNTESLDLTHWQLQVLHAYATRLLQLFAQREARYRQQFGLEARHFEWAFGTPDPSDPEDEVAFISSFDPDSVPGAYRLTLDNGRVMRLCGVVDRIDFSPDGSVAMVTDYKLTRSPRRTEIEAGLAFQPLLYALAVKARYSPERIVIAFDELAHGRRVRLVPYDEGLIRRFRAGEWEGSPSEVMAVLPQSRLEQAITRLREELCHLLTLLQQATVTPTPGEHCRRCAFSDLCRKAVH